MEKKLGYHKPVLRKVQLEVTTSVLATCNTTSNQTALNVPTPGAGCVANVCYTRTS